MVSKKLHNHLEVHNCENMYIENYHLSNISATKEGIFMKFLNLSLKHSNFLPNNMSWRFMYTHVRMTCACQNKQGIEVIKRLIKKQKHYFISLETP